MRAVWWKLSLNRTYLKRIQLPMPPNMENDVQMQEEDEAFTEKMVLEATPRRYTIVYPMVLIFAYWHIGGLYGLYLAITSAKMGTILLNYVIYLIGGWGVTAGAHRLWSHRAYKAKLPLQILLMLLQSLSFQSPIMYWARDHRLHHKYCDTDADPHNSKRGFFYSHIGWLMVRRHPDVKNKGKTMDFSDLYKNPVLEFQRKYYLTISALLAFILPTLIPMYFWHETCNVSYHVTLLRHIIGANITFAINSVAHAFGNKPYDKHISSGQNLSLSLVAFGEGYHNYHHVFPFDYRVSELGNKYLNFSTNFIDFFAWIGWAYDLKHVSPDVIVKRAIRTGDGTDLWGRVKEGFETSNNIWGWGDEDMTKEDMQLLS